MLEAMPQQTGRSKAGTLATALTNQPVVEVNMAGQPNITRRVALLGTAALSIAVVAPVVAAAAHAHAVENTALLKAGAEFERLWAIEVAAKPSGSDGDWSRWDEAYEETRSVVHGIVAIPACSMAGMKIKARAIQWCHGADILDVGANETTDARLANSLIRDLLATI
jgi:hypothetical protein